MQNECTNAPKSFPLFKILDYFTVPTAMGTTKTKRLPPSSPWTAKQHTMMSSTQDTYHGALWTHERSTTPWQNPTHGLWQQTRGKMNGSPPTHVWAHSGERQQQEDNDCLRETIFPIPNFMGHTLSAVIVWVEEFLTRTHSPFCCNKLSAFFYPLLKAARNL